MSDVQLSIHFVRCSNCQADAHIYLSQSTWLVICDVCGSMPLDKEEGLRNFSLLYSRFVKELKFKDADPTL